MRNFMASFDENFEDGGNLHDVVGDPTDIGGRKPRPLKSSWHLHERTPPPDRPTTLVFFIDKRDGDTIAYAKTLEQAMECIRDYGDPTLVLRPFYITEEYLRAEEEYSRLKRQLGV